MKTKLSSIIIFLAVFVTACTKEAVFEEQTTERESVYDGSISYIKAKALEHNTDTNTYKAPVVDIPVCHTNILADDVSEIKRTRYSVFYAMDTHIKAGKSLKIVLRSTDIGHWSHLYYPTPENWTVGAYSYSKDPRNIEQSFTVTTGGKPSRMWISFFPSDVVHIEYYEDGATQPTKTKQLKIKYVDKEALIHPIDSVPILPEAEN